METTVNERQEKKFFFKKSYKLTRHLHIFHSHRWQKNKKFPRTTNRMSWTFNLRTIIDMRLHHIFFLFCVTFWITWKSIKQILFDSRTFFSRSFQFQFSLFFICFLFRFDIVFVESLYDFLFSFYGLVVWRKCNKYTIIAHSINT